MALVEQRDGVDLLDLLDAFVRRDPSPSGLRGRIAVGVRRGAGDRWWIAELGRGTTAARFGDEQPEVDAALLLGGYEADELLHGRPLPEDADLLFAGDAGLIERLLSRYLRKQTMLGLRVARSRAD